MTIMMDNSMVAQNTCLQMWVIGRNTFVGAGSTFTDFNLLPSPLRALNGEGKLSLANRPVLGGCVGHNCRVGSGMVVFPARTIESDTVLFTTHERRVIDKNIPMRRATTSSAPTLTCTSGFTSVPVRPVRNPGEAPGVTRAAALGSSPLLLP